MTDFSFEDQPRYRPLLLPFGVTPGRANVTVDDQDVHVRFGPWRVEISRGNILEATLTGPFHWWKALGIRRSLVDGGITFGTATAAGVCLRLRERVSVRIGRFTVPLRHPGVTVTVADPEALAAVLSTASEPGTG
ncbi:MAG: hypothetical protein WKF54_09895 [Nocardioidaceae bacterium]